MVTTVLAGGLALVGSAVYCARGRRGGLAWLRCVLFSVALVGWAALVAVPPSLVSSVQWWGGCALAIANALLGLLVVLGSPLTWLVGPDDGAPGSTSSLARVGRFLAHPLVSSMVNSAFLIWAFGSGWFDHARDGGVSWLVLLLVTMALGSMQFAALFSRRLLPEVGSGVKVLLGLGVVTMAQAPGLVVLLNQDQWNGGALWVVAQPVVLPMILVLVREWMRDDERRARQIDAELDELDRRRRAAAGL